MVCGFQLKTPSRQRAVEALPKPNAMGYPPDGDMALGLPGGERRTQRRAQLLAPRLPPAVPKIEQRSVRRVAEAAVRRAPSPRHASSHCSKNITATGRRESGGGNGAARQPHRTQLPVNFPNSDIFARCTHEIAHACTTIPATTPPPSSLV
jgi:hypothetical protein